MGLPSPTVFKKIGFNFLEENPEKRKIIINNNPIKIFLGQTLEIENIEIIDLAIDTSLGDTEIMITYIV